MEKSTIYGLGIFLIIVIGGYFLLQGNKENINGNAVEDSFEGQKIILSIKNYNYYPNTLKVKEGIPVRIYLDESVAGCFRDFTIRELGIRKNLKNVNDYIEFTPTEKGTYVFACSMGMGTGKLIVE